VPDEAAPAAEPAEEAPAAPALSAEALAFLPAEALAALPAMITHYLRPEEWAELTTVCPDPTLEARLACLEKPTVEALFSDLFERAVVSTLLARMDIELAMRVEGPLVVSLATACDKDATVWASCAFEAGAESAEKCTEQEDLLASCLVAQDATIELYLDIQAEKKVAFGADAFVDFRGLLAYLSVAQVKSLRADCPMKEAEPLIGCLATHPTVGPILTGFVEAADSLVADVATDLAKAGSDLTDEARAALRERVLNLLFTLPVSAVAELARACEQADPTLADPTTLADVDRALACIDAGATRDPVANPAYISKDKLRGWLQLGRDKVTAALRAKETASQERLSSLLIIVMGILAGLGVIAIFLMPLVLKKKYPSGGAGVWRATVMAAGAFVLSMAVLGGTLLAIRTVQGRVATDSSSPKMRIADAAFDVLMKDDSLDLFVSVSELHLDFIKTPLRAMLKENPDASVAERAEAFAAYIGEHWTSLLNEPEFKRLAKNLSTLQERGAELASLVHLFRKVDWLMGLMPIILALLAVLLYMLPLREWLVSIVTAPMRTQGDANGVVSPLRAMLLGEMKGVPGFLLVLLLLLPIAGIGIAIAIEPLMELFIFSLLSNIFVIIGGETSGLILYGSMIGSMLLMILTLAVFILGIGAASGAAQRILRARFQRNIPLGAHRAFYGKAAASIVWLFVFPVLFALAFQVGANALFESSGDGLATWQLWAVPLGGVVLFALTFVLFRGLSAFKFLKKHRPDAVQA